jgi:hypothetical protein
MSWGAEVHAGFCWGNQSERGHLDDLAIDGKIILKLTSKKWIGLMWHRIGIGGELL